MTQASPELLLDREWLLARYRGDVEFVKEVYQVFLQDAPPKLDRLARSLGGGDQADAAPAAHALKGMLATIGALGASELAARVEKCSRAGDLDQARSLLPDLSGTCDKVMDAVRRETA